MMGRCKECLYWKRYELDGVLGGCGSDKLCYNMQASGEVEPKYGKDLLVYDAELVIDIYIHTGEDFGCIHCEPKS